MNTIDEIHDMCQSTTPTIYFVLPCYNEAEGLQKTAETLEDKILSLIKREVINSNSRVLFVDDGSTDGTWKLIRQIHESNPSFFSGIKLSHNRGHQNALLAGLIEAFHSGCDAAISMDADLQDDVDACDEMIDQYVNHNKEIVFGVRSSRETDTWFKRSSAHLFYKIFHWMGAETIPDHADYRLMGKHALRALSQYQEANLFLRGIVPTLGFETSIVYYKRGIRYAGESKYPLKKMIAFAAEGITSFSTKPLKFVTATGLFSILIGIVMFVYVLVSIFSNHAVIGWGSIMCSLWIIGGCLMLSLGILGEYIGKVYMETKHRPRYFIETRC